MATTNPSDTKRLLDYAAELEATIAGGGTFFAPRDSAGFAAALRRAASQPIDPPPSTLDEFTLIDIRDAYVSGAWDARANRPTDEQIERAGDAYVKSVAVPLAAASRETPAPRDTTPCENCKHARKDHWTSAPHYCAFGLFDGQRDRCRCTAFVAPSLNEPRRAPGPPDPPRNNSKDVA